MTGFYVTGTDTGAGKTFASCALLHALRRAGRRAIGMKPVASGCEATPQGWRNEDALALIAASALTCDYALANPIALPEPTAPEFAARAAGVEVSLPPLVAAFHTLQSMGDPVLVEGVGGWRAPLSRNLTQRHLVQALQLPVLMVVGLRLGCINHALLTESDLRASGCPSFGWIGSWVDPDLRFAEDTIACLRERLVAPCLGILPWRADGDAEAASMSLDVSRLLV
jgi:dethiobiotin synthetase